VIKIVHSRSGVRSVVLHGVSSPHVPSYELVPAPDHDGEGGEDRGVDRGLLPGAPEPERQVLPESLGGPLGLERLEQHRPNEIRGREHRGRLDSLIRQFTHSLTLLPWAAALLAVIAGTPVLAAAVLAVLLQALGGLARGDAFKSGAEMTGQRVEALFRIEARLGSGGTRGSGSPRRGASR
jgi:hypothetical protein